MGKGSSRRPTNEDAYGNNYDSIFKKKPDEATVMQKAEEQKEQPNENPPE